MSKSSSCPFCGQELASDRAEKHLHRSQAQFETKIRREVAEGLNAAAEERFRKREEVAEARAAAKLARVEEQLVAAKEKAKKVGSRKQREKLKEQIRNEVERDQAAHDRKLERTIEQMQRRNEELARRLEGLSAPDRGDQHEVDIFQRLVDAFPEDEITRKGRGGDIVEVVRYPSGRELAVAGTILCECKDTQRWSNAFIDQIRADGHVRKTPYLLLVTRAFPRGEKGMAVRDDVVIADAAHSVHLARILRRLAIEAHRSGLTESDHAGKTARLYEYLNSEEFRDHLRAVVETGTRLDEMLQKERQAHERTWSQRHEIYTGLSRESVAIDETIRGIIESEGPAIGRARATSRSRSRSRGSEAARRARS